jgi:hypothetical protein
VYRCRDCLTVAYRLASDPFLTTQEASKLRVAGEELLEIRHFIEKNRLAGQRAY